MPGSHARGADSLVLLQKKPSSHELTPWELLGNKFRSGTTAATCAAAREAAAGVAGGAAVSEAAEAKGGPGPASKAQKARVCMAKWKREERPARDSGS